MAGWLSRLFGAGTGTQAAISLDPVPGEGGYALGSGPTGQNGYPGSGITNKTVNGTPRDAKIWSDRHSGFEQDTYGKQVVEASYRGDQRGGTPYSPRATQRAVVSRRRVTAFQDAPATNKGGMVFTPQPGAETVGLNPLSGAAAAGGHSVMAGQTPYRQAWPVIADQPIPGAQNVMALWAERYKAVPGTDRAGMSSTRSDNAPPQPMSWQADGEVHPDLLRQEVITTDRLVTPEITWSFDREWPYQRADRLNNGERLYFSAIQQFPDGNMGGVGHYGSYQRRPTTFDVPAPWTGNFYDGQQAPDATQQPDANYVPPPSPRARNSTGRR